MILTHHCALAMVLVLSLWCQYSATYRRMQNSDQLQFNPNFRCPGKNEEIKSWRPCKHGGYIENPDPKNCGDRYVCYVGLNETCDPGDKCVNDGICTMCGICQKCESAEECSEFQLCPNLKNINNLFKRNMQKALIEYNNH